MARRISFITETVFSHPSKVALTERAATLGYLVHLHVILIPEAATVRRVEHRVRRGGHAVPEEKIRERYNRGAVLAYVDTRTTKTAALARR